MTGTTARLTSVMYHYVRDVERTPFPGIKGASIPEFRRHVALVKETFDTPSLEDCIAFLQGEWVPDRNLCILTFDDGLREHHDTVAEILVDEGVPGAFFLPTAALEEHEVLAVHMNHFLLAFLGTAEFRAHFERAAIDLGISLPDEPTPEQVRAAYRWDDDETARFKYLVNHQLAPSMSERILAHVFPEVLGDPVEFAKTLYVDWDMARSMQTSGLHVGGHSHRHKVLASLSDDERRSDLERCRDLLSANLGEERCGFAYPYGKPATYSEGTIDDLDELGFSCAFNTTVDMGRTGTSVWEIPRIDPKDL